MQQHKFCRSISSLIAQIIWEIFPKMTHLKNNATQHDNSETKYCTIKTKSLTYGKCTAATTVAIFFACHYSLHPSTEVLWKGGKQKTNKRSYRTYYE